MLPEEESAPQLDLLDGDLPADAGEISKRFQRQVRREIAERLASGQPIYFGGKADQAGKLFMRTPAGEVHEILPISAGHNGVSGNATR